MANSAVLKDLLKEYDLKHNKAIAKASDKKNELYKKLPRLQEIDDELNQYAIETAKSILSSSNDNAVSELNEKIQLLKNERNSILEKDNKSISYFSPMFECSICNDTAYILENGKTSMCNCLKQRLLDIEYNKSNIGNLEKENFKKFNINLYSDEIDENKYNAEISPRENIKIIGKEVKKFIKNFNHPDEKNLLFSGATGLGKTFLSNCIVAELISQGKTVLYQTAPVMLDTIIDYRFNKNDGTIYNSLLTVDLLIIDDLGTETINSMKFTELFNIINSRLLNPINKTIISTNLSLNELYSYYDERIVSRFVGNYSICKFFGDDIRFKK